MRFRLDKQWWLTHRIICASRPTRQKEFINARSKQHCDAIDIAADAKLSATPPIDARRLQAEFGPPRETLLALLPALLEGFVAHVTAVGI